MSVSSGSEAPYNEFYERGNDSADERAGSETQQADKSSTRRRGQQRASGFSELFAPFRSCCFSSSEAQTSAIYRRPGSARMVGPAGQYVLQTARVTDSDPDTATTSSDDEVALGAGVQTYEAPASKKKQQKGGDILSAAGIDSSQLMSSRSLDAGAKSRLELSLERSIELEYFELTEAQLRLAAVQCCLEFCRSQKPTHRLLERLLSISLTTFKEDISVEQALKKYEGFDFLKNLRRVEARLIEELLGELQVLLEIETGTDAFLVISNVRTIAVSCKALDQLLLILVYDSGASLERGPAILQFDEISKVEKYIIQLFSKDPRVGSQTKFTSWILLGQHPTGFAPKPTPAYVEAEARPSDEEGSSPASPADPLQYAKDAYSAMIGASVVPLRQENVFAQSAAGNVVVQDKKSNKQ